MAIRRHMSPEQQRRTAEWCFRLKSKRYQQGTGYLHYIVNGEEFYCCLGVASEYAVEEGVTDKVVVPDPETPGRELVKYGQCQEAGVLTDKIKQWFGLSDYNPGVAAPGEDSFEGVPLARLNDAGTDFDTIADLIAKQWLDDPFRFEVLNYTPPEE